MNYFKKILDYARPYKKYAVLNIIANVFYAFFGTLAFVSLMPMLKVLFGNGEKVLVKPTYLGITKIGDYFDSFVFKLIQNWTIVFENNLKFVINQYRILKVITSIIN